MSENKELLEATVKGLQEKIISLQHDLREKEKDLEVKVIVNGQRYNII